MANLMSLFGNVLLKNDSILLNISKFQMSYGKDIQEFTDSSSAAFFESYHRVAIKINNTKSMMLKITAHLSIISTMAFPWIMAFATLTCTSAFAVPNFYISPKFI